MSDQKLTTIVSFVLMLATAMLGWFTLNDRLTLPKISADRSLGVVVASEQDVTARLWEDPLQAVQMEAGKKNDTSPHEPKEFVEAFRRKLGSTNRVCLLVVPIPGTPFPDDVETRLRLRYSVEMALADQNCSPEDRNHLGYVKLPWPSDDGVHLHHWPSPQIDRPSVTNVVFDGQVALETNAYGVHVTATPSPLPEPPRLWPQINPDYFFNIWRKQVNVPYEWFESGKSPGLKIVVLWLPEEFLSSEPLCRLAYLRATLMTTVPEIRPRCLGPFVVGPRSSNALKVMALGEFSTKNHICSALLETNLCIFSPQATAPDALISLAPSEDWDDARKDMADKLKTRLPQTPNSEWVYFNNFIAPDDQLTDLLVRELDLRNINIASNSADRVLILAEADTSYGKSLPLAFQASLQSFRENRCATPLLLTNFVAHAPPEATLIVARYLQGLDAQKGFQGTDSSSSKDRSKSAEQLLADALNKKSAPAVGESQLDYAERLAEHLAHDKSSKQVKAVGVLGSDIYDKLLLLRSLRARFPEALFFTTDLDARLWHPDHLKFTRNLVVASAHDLNIGTTNAAFRIAPFRDVYQVTVFNACVAAITNAVLTASGTNFGQHPRAKPKLTPAIYEIGRRGDVLLARADPDFRRVAGSKRGAWRAALLQMIKGWWLYGTLYFSWKGFGFFVAGSLLLLWILLWRYWPKNDPTEMTFSGLFQRKACWVGIFGTVTSVFLLVLARTKSESGLWGVFLLCTGAWLLLCLLQMRKARFFELFRSRTGWAGYFVTATSLLLAFSALVFSSISELPGGEPWSWSESISVWPTELVRLLSICVVLWMLTRAWHRFRRHRINLLKEFKLHSKDVSLKGRIYLTGKNRIRTAWERVFDPWPNSQRGTEGRLEIDAAKVFGCYLAKTTLGARLFRIMIGCAIYFSLGMGLMQLSGMPLNTHIRGVAAGVLDVGILMVSIIGWLMLVFYVLDAVYMSSQMLRCVGGPFTIWPESLLDKTAHDLRVGKEDLEGYLDVQFAAEKTQETGKLIFLPFIIQFIMLIARNTYFDNWSWPALLIMIFVGNVLLSGAAWIILRRSAAQLKSEALKKLNHNLRAAERLILEKPAEKPLHEIRKAGLQEIKRRIDDENRGAYARWIQDPAFLAVLVPTGLLGILNVLFQALFGFM